MKTSQLAIRYFLLWLIITILIMAVSALFSIQKYFQLAEAQMQTAAIMNLVVNLTYALILGTIVHLSTWHGIKLIGALFLAFFGITGFLTQIETWAYLKVLVDIVPMPAIRRLVIGSIINGVLVSVLTPVIWGKTQRKKCSKSRQCVAGITSLPMGMETGCHRNRLHCHLFRLRCFGGQATGRGDFL